MRDKILNATICLLLFISGLIAMSGGPSGVSREENIFSATPIEGANHIDIDFNKLSEDPRDEDINSLASISQADETRDPSIAGFTPGIYNFLSWIGSNIKDFFGWAGSNIWDFFSWAGSNIWDFFSWAGSNLYAASLVLGRGGIVLLVVIFLIALTYGAIMI